MTTAAGMVYWVAVVSDEDDFYATDTVFGDGYEVDQMYDLVSQEVKDESARLGVPIEWFGPLTLPKAA